MNFGAKLCLMLVIVVISSMLLYINMSRNSVLQLELQKTRSDNAKLREENDLLRRNRANTQTVVQPAFKCTRHYTFKCMKDMYAYENPVLDYVDKKDIVSRYAVLPDEIYNWTKLREEQEHLIQHLKPFGSEPEYDYKNDMVGPLDQWTLYTITRYFKPKRIIEIGSGFSTRVLHQAMLANRKEGYQTNITCIEPFRANVLTELKEDVKVINKQVQHVDVSVFKELEPGDFLIIDNSHVMQPYGDTILEFNFIVPLVPKGTIVHFHDIFVPYDYPLRWMTESRQYTEQFMFASFLYGNSHFKIALSVHNMDKHSKYRDEIRKTVKYPEDSVMNGLDSGMWLIKDTSFDPKVKVVR